MFIGTHRAPAPKILGVHLKTVIGGAGLGAASLLAHETLTAEELPKVKDRPRA